MESDILILPDNPLFALTLNGSLPPDWMEKADRLGHFPNFVCDAATGLMRPVSRAEMIDYIEGGEYEERLDRGEEFEIDVVPF